MTTSPSPSIQAMQSNAGMFTLRNGADMRVTLSEHGAAMVSWLAPDRYGRMADVLLGYPDARDYAANPVFFGAIIGRWANRIARGRFMLDGRPVQVDVNDRGNHLHGGAGGFHALRWRGGATQDGVSFRLVSGAGEGGFPGEVDVLVHYRLDDDGSLVIAYEAESDQATPLNLTAHPYFNLNGGVADVGDHLLRIDAGHYLQTDATGIPTGVATVAGSPFDFRAPAPIGPRLVWPHGQLELNGGFDHCYCIDGRGDGRAGPLREVARVVDPGSGRCLQVSTTEAGLQFYSGNWLDGVPGRGRRPYARHDGFCLEAHAFPDQLNSEHAAAVILRPGEVYRQTTIYRLSHQR